MDKMKIGGDTVLVLSSVPTAGATEEVKEKAENDSDEVVAAVTQTEESTEALVSSADDTKASEDTKNCYDKTRSFFDSISCEAVERSKG